MEEKEEEEETVCLDLDLVVCFFYRKIKRN